MAFGDLCQLSDVTTWLQTGQNPFPATDDALLTRLITAASQFIQSWLQRQIAVSDWIEMRDGNGGQRMAFAKQASEELHVKEEMERLRVQAA